MAIKFDSKLAILIFVVGIAVSLRLLGLFQPLYGDEYVWVVTAQEQAFLDYPSGHPPLSFWIQNMIFSFFGQSPVALKAGVAAVSLLNIFLIYYIASRFYDSLSGVIAAFLLVLSPWYLAGSLQLDQDASFLTLWFLLMSFFYMLYYRTQNSRYLVMTGIFLGCSFLTKYSSIIFPAIIFTHYFGHTSSADSLFSRIVKAVRITSVVSFIGLAIFLIFPLLAYIFGSTSLSASIQHNGGLTFFSSGGSFLSLLIQVGHAVIWMGPLILGLFCLYAWTSWKKFDYFFIASCAIILFYTVIVRDPFRPIERYLLVAAAPMSLLGAVFLRRYWSKDYVPAYACGTFLLTLFMYMTSLGPYRILNFYPKEAFVDQVLSLDWSFLMPISMSSGPQGFYVHFGVIGFGFILAAVLAIGFLVLRNPQLAVVFLIAFLSVGTAYSLIFTGGYLSGKPYVYYPSVTDEVLKYTLSNNLSEPIYVTRNFALKYYWTVDGEYEEIRHVHYHDKLTKSDINTIVSHGTFVHVDFPKFDKESALWRSLNEECDLIKRVTRARTDVAFVFSCPSTN